MFYDEFSAIVYLGFFFSNNIFMYFSQPFFVQNWSTVFISYTFSVNLRQFYFSWYQMHLAAFQENVFHLVFHIIMYF